MPTWDRILCAVDFSEESRLAMEAAADLARRYESHLTLVHVHEPPMAVKPAALLAPPTLFEGDAREKEEELELWRTEAERLAGSPVRSLLLYGHAAVEIVRSVEEDRADLVVIGTRGLTGLKRMVLGSVAERVVLVAPCPVFVMRAARGQRTTP